MVNKYGIDVVPGCTALVKDSWGYVVLVYDEPFGANKPQVMLSGWHGRKTSTFSIDMVKEVKEVIDAV